MSTDIRILLVEDSEDDAELLLREIRRGGYTPCFRRVSSRADMLREVEEHEWDIILSDYTMPGFSGVGALEVWNEKGLDIPFIIISGTIGEETAVMMMKAGASDYMMKQNLTRLNAAIRRELRDAHVRRERKQAEYLLLDSERRFSLFMDHFPGLVFIQDAFGQMLFVNRQFKEAFPTVAALPDGLRDPLRDRRRRTRRLRSTTWPPYSPARPSKPTTTSSSPN